MQNRTEIGVSTPVLHCDEQTVARLQEDRKNGRVGGTTALFSASNKALYFSKEVLLRTPVEYCTT